MTVANRPLFVLDHAFARDLEGMYVPWQAAGAPEPRLLVLNEAVARDLGLDPDALRSPEGVAVLAGNTVPEGATPIAQAYAGHQFGNYSPRLGDGRALLLGELVDVHGDRRDLHLKGSGRTPFARGGDGKAAVGPMLREYVISEAMHGLGIPTTRSLAVVATGEAIARETMLPGAILARIASSHLRVGSFQYAAALDDAELLRRLADHAIARHHPDASAAENPYLALYEGVMDAQASLVAQWMLVGFIHGVMNTDNMTISGETIDYGPCAFMDAFDPATVFSSIDHAGRYAYGNQPRIAQWNLARLAEAMLPLLHPEPEQAVAAATELLQSFPDRYLRAWTAGMRAKTGLRSVVPEADGELFDDLLELLHAQAVDHTLFFRSLSTTVRGDSSVTRSLFVEPAAFDVWAARWQSRRAAEGHDDATVADAMDRVNPIRIPRNHLVEAALADATAGDLAAFERLVDAVSRPFEPRADLDDLAAAPPAPTVPYQTFCGT